MTNSIRKNMWVWYKSDMVHIEKIEDSTCKYSVAGNNRKRTAKLTDLEIIQRGDQCIVTGDAEDAWMSVFAKDTIVTISQIDHSDKRNPIRLVGKNRKDKTTLRWSQPQAIKLHKRRAEMKSDENVIVLSLSDKQVQHLGEASEKTKNKAVTKLIAKILKQVIA